MQHILVTGGTGYIGSHVVLKLLKSGYKVTVLDSNINSSSKVITRIKTLLSNNYSEYIRNLEFTKGDVRDYNFLDNIFQKYKQIKINIDAVIHLAGLKSVLESKKKPINYSEVNIGGSINLFKVMDKYNCRNLVFSSSATVYGEVNNPPFKEYFPLSPQNPYAKNKVVVETILQDIFKSNKQNWRIIILRYFNPIGSHPSGLLGEDPKGVSDNLFPKILDVYINKKILYIYGNDWQTNDGTCIRDFIHVDDLALGHIKAIEKIFSIKNGLLIYNLGSGNGTSVLELIRTFEEANNASIQYEFAQRRPGDTAVAFSDIQKASIDLNWSPKNTLYDMCRDGYNWICKNLNGYDD